MNIGGTVEDGGSLIVSLSGPLMVRVGGPLMVRVGGPLTVCFDKPLLLYLDGICSLCPGMGRGTVYLYSIVTLSFGSDEST